MHVVRRPSVLAATLAAILVAGSSLLSTGATAANASVRPAASSASSVSPDYTCPSGYTCFFSGDNYNDTVYGPYLNVQLGGGISYSFNVNLGIPNPGSAHINGGSTLWVKNTSNGGLACIYDGKIPLDHNYNVFWVNYGADTC